MSQHGESSSMRRPEAPGPETVLGKTMKVLLAFSVESTMLGFAELRARTELPKATLHRLLADLVGARLLERVDGKYRLSRLVFELGMRASVERTLLEVAMPFLEDLSERTQETVHLGVLEGDEVVYVAKLGGHRQASAPSSIGGRMPLHATAIGKALLAGAGDEVIDRVLAGRLRRCSARTIVNRSVLRGQLQDILERGISFEYEESAPGIVCVAAPIHDQDGRAIAGVSVTGRKGRFQPARHAQAVRSAGAGIGATLVRRANLSGGSGHRN
ncbi:MAG TPA: IclR family transcriptional regulator [Flexivirga sp.]|uniref:IclR family transcriptional regulator n=1 Tax=Flexivirga sp. TaxID=1962927 RepID=UPI002B700F0C|nr:IclR family transcriptional regulator [Flexivirga sp.]HWC21692.1 IclR family transcriptional regulator [Flexivirga sp.]